VLLAAVVDVLAVDRDFQYSCAVRCSVCHIISFLPYLTSGVDRLLHLPSAEAVSAWPNVRPRM